jgi:hypothetical protein
MAAEHLLQSVEVRPIRRDEKDRWKRLMREHHYLGFEGLFGEQVFYVATMGERWVALMAWAVSALKVASRDEWIGWTPWMRLNRLKFVVNNARFLVLPGARAPNLASRVLGLNLRRLSRDFLAFYGHPVLLAETFVEAERFRGTCYRAAGWTELGATRGFSRSSRFGYVANGVRKRVWVKPLGKDAIRRLSDPFRDPAHPRERMLMIDFRKLPIEGRGGLIDVLNTLPDPRSRHGREHSFVSILAISVCAILSGARSYEAIQAWALTLSASQLRKFRVRKTAPPSETTFRRTLQRIDPVALDERLYAWLAEQAGFKAELAAIAIDGKTVRRSHDNGKKAVHLLSAFLHEQEVTIGQRSVDEKTNEIPAVKDLLDPLPIEGSVITADALHTQAETARYLVRDKGADFLFTVKDNQPRLRAELANAFSGGDAAFPPSGD